MSPLGGHAGQPSGKQPEAFQTISQGPMPSAQLKLQRGIDVSPRQQSQAAQLKDMFGPIIQRKKAESQNAVPEPAQPRQIDSSNAKITQGVFVYSREYQAIHSANKNSSYYQGIGFKTYTSKNGYQVLADARNSVAVGQADVTEEVRQREIRIARNKLRQEQINEEDHEVRDKDVGLSFVQDGEVKTDLLIVQPKVLGENEPIFSYGEEFCIEGDGVGNPGTIFKVTRKMVTDYWESPRSEEELPPKGSFAGYTRDVRLGPDERYNCAAYALGNEKRWIEPEDMHEILNTEEYSKLENHTAMETDVDYIVAQSNHFWRAKKLGEDTYLCSEKNGPSPVYHKRLDKEQWTSYMADLSGSIRGIYTKK